MGKFNFETDRKWNKFMTNQINEPLSIDMLIASLSDPDLGVRFGAIEDLAYFEYPRGIDALINAFSSQDSEMRKRIVWVLGIIGDTRAVDALLKALVDQ